MSEVVVSRVSQTYGCGQSMHVYIDGKKVGTVDNGRSTTFKVKPGVHDFQVKLTLVTKSPTVSIKVKDGEAADVEVGHCVPAWMTLTVFPHLLSMVFGRTYLYAKKV